MYKVAAIKRVGITFDMYPKAKPRNLKKIYSNFFKIIFFNDNLMNKIQVNESFGSI